MTDVRFKINTVGKVFIKRLLCLSSVVDLRTQRAAKMCEINAEQVLTRLSHLQIDDTKVNKMIRRRSIRIQQKQDRRSLDVSFDLANNNWAPIDSEREKDQGNDVNDKDKGHNKGKEPAKNESEFGLEPENVHYQKAVKLFTYITRSEYCVRRNKNDCDDEGGDCGCVLTAAQLRLGEMGCIKNCLNHQTSIECDTNCKLGEFCGNQRFQRFDNAPVTVFITEKKGYGLFASKDIPKGTFIMEFVGEIVSMTEFKKRSLEYAKQKTRHCYVMTSSGKRLIDATKKGNLTRFVNHSCDPNAETQKWTVNGEDRIGVFSKESIKMFEEITINYQFERFG